MNSNQLVARVHSMIRAAHGRPFRVRVIVENEDDMVEVAFGGAFINDTISSDYMLIEIGGYLPGMSIVHHSIIDTPPPEPALNDFGGWRSIVGQITEDGAIRIPRKDGAELWRNVAVFLRAAGVDL